jgi:hypothetical protein
VDRKEEIITRQQRRAEKLKKKKERMPKHGKGLAQAYKDASLKKLKIQDKEG